MMKISSLLVAAGFCVFLQRLKAETESPSWRSDSPEDLPRLEGLQVECGNDDMSIYLHFDRPFDGSVYSKASSHGSRCVHVAPHSHVTDATFAIEYDTCGTRSDPKGKYYENTIIIQYDDVVVEAWDIAKKIRCEWHDGYEKSAFKQPIAISDLDVVEMNFQGDDVDCWLEIQDGKGPWSSKVEGLIPLGSPLTLVVAIQDAEGQFDMRVKSCKAHDGHKHPVYLTNENGCVLRPKMMSPFVKTRDTRGAATIVSYSHFYAFKFPETVDVNIQCTVEICRHGCPDVCDSSHMEGKIVDDSSSDNDEDVDDIPTYRDSNPHSSVITTKPKNKNSTKPGEYVEILTDQTGNTSSSEELHKDASNIMHKYTPYMYPSNLFDAYHAENELHHSSDEHEDMFDDQYSENHAEFSYQTATDISNNADAIAKGFSSEDTKNSPVSHIHSSVLNSTLATNLEMPALIRNESVEVNNRNVDLLNTSRGTESSVDNGEEELSTSTSVYPQETTAEILTEYSTNSTTEITSVQQTEEPPSDKITDLPIEVSPSDEEEYLNLEVNTLEDYYEQHENNEKNLHTSIAEKGHEKLLRARDYVQGRTPSTHDFQSKQQDYYYYKPFKPPKPIPPLTLYNGIPLHYYNQYEANLKHVSKSYRPIQTENPYVESARLYTKHRARRRREIGEREQLGLQQTFRVIAPTDLDFVIADGWNFRTKGKETAPEMCITTSSFTAGLGLLLLANVCIICGVINLVKCYVKQRKTKIKAMELLSKEGNS